MGIVIVDPVFGLSHRRSMRVPLLRSNVTPTHILVLWGGETECATRDEPFPEVFNIADFWDERNVLLSNYDVNLLISLDSSA